ncbi:hypothetical protein COLO4_08091 [Corchorus olitorius]|uniref:Uncharacterized protein n=1 Tax=Corchorus olitorius TaxID=93759 RepID=A0A1R3KHE9_9ROSI|nr:hypothetical protein COLO4_08091 [Corchorus olitorius]
MARILPFQKMMHLRLIWPKMPTSMVKMIL